jgi:pyridoxamine 5'-phosphate oxidase
MDSLESQLITDHETPFPLFAEWFAEALDCDGIKDATAMTLATVDSDHQPWTRVLLLKGHGEDGFTFFTNSNSIKGDQLTPDAKVSLCFYWPPLDKQVRINGTAKRVSSEESDEYFASRPRESQVGAWASKQSTELDQRRTLMDRVDEYAAKFEGGEVPRPDFWNGYRVTPDLIEFWLSRPHRLHERLMYIRESDATWTQKGLYP